MPGFVLFVLFSARKAARGTIRLGEEMIIRPNFESSSKKSAQVDVDLEISKKVVDHESKNKDNSNTMKG